MITRIEVDGFKSLRGFSLELSPLTAIIGANGAGKSNLLDAMKLLSLLAQNNVTEALKSGRGAVRDQFSRTGSGVVDGIRISTDMLLATAPEHAEPRAPEAVQTRVRHVMEIARTTLPSGVEDVSVARERIDMLGHAGDAWISAHPAFAPMARYGEEDNLRITVEPAPSPLDHARRQMTISYTRENVHSAADIGRHRSLLGVTGPFMGGVIEDIAAELRAFRLVHLEAARLRLPSDRAAGAELSADGSNLPTALASLAPDVRLQIRADLAELIPGFRSFDVVPADEELRLEIELTDGARVPARVLSDGTLRLVALLTLLRSARPGSVIAVEEPENGIYPGRLRAFVDKLVDATTPVGPELPPQVVLTTHSPAILAALRERPDTLVLADLVRRGTDLRSTRMRTVQSGAPSTNGAPTASIREIERILDAARPEDEA